VLGLGERLRRLIEEALKHMNVLLMSGLRLLRRAGMKGERAGQH